MGEFSTSDAAFHPRTWGSKRKLFFSLGVVGLFLLTISALRRPDRFKDLSVHLLGGQRALSSENLKDPRNTTLGVCAVNSFDLPES